MLFFAYGRLEPAYIYVLFYAVNIGYFYALAHSLKNIFDRPRGHWPWELVKLTGFILIYLAVKFFTNYLTAKPGLSLDVYSGNLANTLATIFYRAGHFTLLAIFYWAAGHIAYYRRRAAEAERQQLLVRLQKADLEATFARVQNAYLQQQINPHLLFNTLNFVYSRVMDAAPEAGRCLVLLSDLLRYGLAAADKDGYVALAEEIEQLEHLLDMNRYRFAGEMFIDTACNTTLDNIRILSLVILTLAENVFKHGDLTQREKPAKIRITASTNFIQFYSNNEIKDGAGYRRKAGQGLENIRLRLAHAYGKSGYTLNTYEKENRFIVRMTIGFHSDPNDAGIEAI